MKWEKKGLIYCPDGSSKWARHTVITPTPILLNDVIRIYAGFRDDQGISRIGYIDVDIENPSKIRNVSKQPILDIGQNGMFDDNGIILGDLSWHNDTLRMYYVGFQKVSKAKFLAYSGLAISNDGGNTFARYQKTPIIDRVENALYIRAVHTVLRENGNYRVWYSVGNGWETINGIPYPKYDIRYTESKDGINFSDSIGVHCIGVQDDEYRIGRPRVRKIKNGYEMRYTYDTLQKKYCTGYALSTDGISWKRRDDLLDIKVSKSGWDSEMVCYPVILDTPKTQYMFYSGNGMGYTGVGYAERANTTVKL
tara:strand:- start:805 stop:1731 length:927 start_codon:yes stop_codon:yes gene_type:complete